MTPSTNVRAPLLSWLAAALLSLLAVSPAAADGRHRACLAPSGGDDTAALQTALDRCSGAKKHGCTVRLCAGTFDTGILRVRDFRGTLRGAGVRKTVLRALPDLHVSENIHDFFRDDPFLPDQAWPYLVQFIEGSGRVEDLGILVPVPPPGSMPTTGWSLDGSKPIFELRGGILVTGRSELDFVVRNVRVGAENPGTDLQTTVFHGVEFGGLLFNSDDASKFPVFPARGRFRVQESTFDGVLTGTALSELAAAHVLVYGNRNRSTIAVDVIDVDRSRIGVLKNRWVVSAFGVQVRQNVEGAPSRESRLVVAANRGRIEPLFAGGFGAALWFEDPSPPGSAAEPGATHLRVLGNSWTLTGGAGPALSAITVTGADRLRIASNRLGGQALTGIEVDATEGCRVFGNSTHRLDTGVGPDLHLGPATRDCVAIVDDDDVVVDDGVANRVIRR